MGLSGGGQAWPEAAAGHWGSFRKFRQFCDPIPERTWDSHSLVTLVQMPGYSTMPKGATHFIKCGQPFKGLPGRSFVGRSALKRAFPLGINGFQ